MASKGHALPVGQEVARASVWTLLQHLAVRGMGLVSTVVLARVLVPEQFGVVAMATSVLAMVEVFTSLRFDVALIRNQEATRAEYDTAWTLNVGLSLCVAIALVLIAQPAATFFGEPRVAPVMYALALSPLLDGFRNVGIVDFRKNFQFHKEFQIEVWRKLAAVLVNIPLALAWRSHWTLVVSTLVGGLVALVMSYRMHPFRPRPSLAATGGLLKFSGWFLALNIVNFLRLRVATLVIGRTSGPAALGTFNMAYVISNLPTTEIVMPINKAVLPAYARLAGTDGRLRNGLLQVTAVIALFALPAAAGVAALASLIVPVMLGPKWLPAIPVIQWLALFGAAMSLQTNLQSLYHALGKPHLAFTRSLASVAVLLPLLIWLVSVDGIKGAAIAYLIAAVATMPFNFHMALQLTGTPWASLLGALLRPLVGSLVMALVLYFVQPADAAHMTTWAALPWLLGCIAVGGAVYVGVVLAVWLAAGRPAGAETYVLGHAERLLWRLRGQEG